MSDSRQTDPTATPDAPTGPGGLPDRSGEYGVTSLGKLRMRAAWQVEELHGNSRHHLYWITRGQGRALIGGINRGWGPNTAIFVPAGLPMSLELPAQIQGLVLQIPPDPLLDLPVRPFHLRISEIEAQASLTGFIERIETELSRGGLAMDRALRAHTMLVSVWIERALAKQDGTIERRKTHRLVLDFAALLEQGFREGKGVADFAALLSVSPTHLSRLCREASGRPAHALIHERVMHEARMLLTGTDMTANRISQALGFSSPAYFTRAFSQFTGMTPLAFRAAARPGF